MSAGNWQRQDLVPLSQRLRIVQLYRIVVVLVTAGLATWNGPAPTGPTVVAFGVAAVTVCQLAELAVRRTRTLGHRLFGVVLLLDGLLLITLLHQLGGLVSPARYLVVLHLVLITLVASHRTGVKLVIWHSLLVLVHHEAVEIGWLVVTDLATPGAALAIQIALLCGATIVTAMASAVNEREILRRRYDLDALANMSTALEDASTLHEITETVLDHLCSTFDLPRAVAVSLRHGDPVVVAARGVTPPSRAGAIEGTLAIVADRRQRVLVERLGEADRWLGEQFVDGRNLMFLPLAPDGNVDDVLVLEHPKSVSGRLERRISSTVERFASHGALAMRNARLHAELVALAQTDGLTGVANRMTFDRTLAAELARVDRHHGSLSLVLCDLDHFKAVNDTHGHQTGDEVLIETAQVLRTSTRPYDLVARYGGEEFAIVMPDAEEATAAQLAERLRSAVVSDVTTIAVTLSVGVVTVRGTATDPGTLIAAADEALYRAKREGRNRVCVADPVPRPVVDH